MANWNRIVVAAALAGTLIAVPDGAYAQAANAQSAKDQQELKDYKLTMEVINRIAKANQAATQARSKDPKRQKLAKQMAELAALEAKDDPTEAEQERMAVLEDEIERFEDDDAPVLGLNGAATISDYARYVDANPALAAAVRSVGLSSREYATAMLALVEASIAHEFMKLQKTKQAPPGISPHNLEFVRTNEKQIAALGVVAQDSR